MTIISELFIELRLHCTCTCTNYIYIVDVIQKRTIIDIVLARLRDPVNGVNGGRPSNFYLTVVLAVYLCDWDCCRARTQASLPCYRASRCTLYSSQLEFSRLKLNATQTGSWRHRLEQSMVDLAFCVRKGGSVAQRALPLYCTAPNTFHL